MFDRTTLRNFFAPRRKERKEIQKSRNPTLTKGDRGGLEELGVPFGVVQDMLCMFARVIILDSVIHLQPKISNIFG
jgi:hypothetical protein